MASLDGSVFEAGASGKGGGFVCIWPGHTVSGCTSFASSLTCWAASSSELPRALFTVRSLCSPFLLNSWLMYGSCHQVLTGCLFCWKVSRFRSSVSLRGPEDSLGRPPASPTAWGLLTVMSIGGWLIYACLSWLPPTSLATSVAPGNVLLGGLVPAAAEVGLGPGPCSGRPGCHPTF